MQIRAARVDPFGLFVFAISVALGMWNLIHTSSRPVAFRDFMLEAQAGRIVEVSITGQKVSGLYRAERGTFHTYAPDHYRNLASKLSAQGIPVRP
jgi:hypothetical protein